MIVGHSRGGEGVGHASFFNRLTLDSARLVSPIVMLDGSAGLRTVRFGLRVAAAIAPTDRQYVPVTGSTVVPDRYFLIHGSRDGDVSNFPGYNTYNRAHAVDLANPTVSDGRFKALLWVTVPTTTSSTASGRRKRRRATTMPRASQEQVAKVTSARSRRRCCSTARNTWTCYAITPRRTGCPPAPISCRSIRIPDASSSSTTRKASSHLRSPPGARNGRGRRAGDGATVQGSRQRGWDDQHDDHAAPRVERVGSATAPETGSWPPFPPNATRCWRFASASRPRRRMPPIAIRTSARSVERARRTAAISCELASTGCSIPMSFRRRQDRDADAAAADSAACRRRRRASRPAIDRLAFQRSGDRRRLCRRRAAFQLVDRINGK